MLRRYIGHREIIRTSKLKTGEIRKHATGKFPDGPSINRELALLRSIFLFAKREKPHWTHVPHFPMLAENPAREVYLRDEQYSAVAEECMKVGIWLRAMFEIYCTYGWRKSEVLGLRVRQIDLIRHTISLDDSKNGEGRLVDMSQRVFDLLSFCVANKQASDYVFTRAKGKAVRDFRKTWRKVCQAVGVPDMHIHDLRRTAATGMIDMGLDTKLAMETLGHKTPSMLQRYKIVDRKHRAKQADVMNAKYAALDRQLEESRYGHVRPSAEQQSSATALPN